MSWRGRDPLPYRSGCYALESSLRATPHIGGPGQKARDDVDMSKLSLIRIASQVWLDVVFVNVNGHRIGPWRGAPPAACC